LQDVTTLLFDCVTTLLFVLRDETELSNSGGIQHEKVEIVQPHTMQALLFGVDHMRLIIYMDERSDSAT
jgi:hypothetical protein